MYETYKCICGREFIVLTDEAREANKRGIYLTCPYCSSKRIRIEGKYESIKERIKNDERRRWGTTLNIIQVLSKIIKAL